MEIVEILSVFLGSMIKIVLGIVGGYLAGFPIWLTAVLTAGGMMTAVFLFTFFGTWLKRRLIDRLRRKSRVFSRRNRRWVRIWRNYGMPGVAFLTPILLMPIGGTLIATSFGSPKKKILSYMLISIIGWTVPLTWAFYKFAALILPYFAK